MVKHSELMVKDKELLTLREDNRLLAKQFREKKKVRKKRERFLKVIIATNQTHCIVELFILQNE